MSAPRKPDFDLSFRATNDHTNKGNIGCAWLEVDGRISITLNKMVVLRQQDKLQLCLFPKGWHKTYKEKDIEPTTTEVQ